jgi:circadian clock protein KaiB
MKKDKSLDIVENNKELTSYVFRLYITGASPNSSRAITNLKTFFEQHLENRYELQVIDIYQQPHVAKSVDIIALPLLIKKFPLPERRLIGDMSNSEKIFKTLNLAS